MIIGLDGATFDIIKPMVQAGFLPTFANLISQGVHGPLKAWPNLNSAAAWSSIVTGYNPGMHGVHDFGSAPPQRGYTWHPMTALDRKKDPFWRLLSARGKRVNIINVPISYPADPVNGFMLAGMDTPGLSSHGFAHPPELQAELDRQGISYIIDVPNLGDLSRKHPDQLPIEVKKMVEARSRTILYLMKKPWDAFMAVFVAPDRVQHYYWPKEEFSLEKSEWAPIREIYQLIDSFLGDVLTRMDKDTTILLVSDHGFGSILEANRLLNHLFAKLGLLNFRQGPNRLQGRLLKALLLYGRRYIPYRLQYPLSRIFRKLHIQAVSESMFAGIDWSRTQAFASPHGGQVFINLKGRQPEGTVSSEDYPSLRETLRGILQDLIDPTTGIRVIKEVHLRENIFRGPHSDPAGDLVIEWNIEALGKALCSPTPGHQASVSISKDLRFFQEWTGTHRSFGIFIAYGPQIKKGETISTATQYDITPTLLYLQGHPIPNDMDGKVLTDIFTEDHLNHHPIQYSEPPNIQWKVSADELDAEEKQKIEERLRGLGYIE
jgi:predicted AlkP superfamily phosphohydrolase/phosphomutase